MMDMGDWMRWVETLHCNVSTVTPWFFIDVNPIYDPVLLQTHYQRGDWVWRLVFGYGVGW